MICSIADCNSKHYGKSYCLMHWQRARTGGDMNAPKRKLHGLSHHQRLNRIWENVRQRCNNPNNPNYQHYGGRGITICNEWKGDFEPFCRWALSAGYQDSLTLDRVDVNGNYEPANCRWVTRMEQSNNLRNNVVIEFDGKVMTLPQWSRHTGISQHTLRWRRSYGWPTDRVLTTPVDIKYRAKRMT